MLKFRDFKREGLVLVKNVGVREAAKFLLGVGLGSLGYVGLTYVIPSWKVKTDFDEKYMKACVGVGFAATTAAITMLDCSEHHQCITANKGALSEDYIEHVNLLPKDY